MTRLSSFVIETQGSLMKTARSVWWQTDVKSDRLVTWKRGDIQHFSKKSRKRIIEKTSRLEGTSGGKRTKFLTFTYGDDFPDTETAKNHLRAFLERIRRAFPKASAVWRLEYQKRGAPHFHLIVFGMDYVKKKEIQRMWAEITNQTRPFTRIEALKSKRGVMSYVSKYIAKVTEVKQQISAETGEVTYIVEDTKWNPKTKQVEDASWEVDTSVWSVEDAAGGTGFNITPYLHAGRYWGVFNAQFLPWAEKRFVKVIGEYWKIYWHFRRACRKHYKYLSKFTHETPVGTLAAGWTMFMNDPDTWIRYLHHLGMVYSLENTGEPVLVVDCDSW